LARDTVLPSGTAICKKAVLSGTEHIFGELMIPSNFQGIFILDPNKQNASATGKKINHKQFISCSHLP
jgi:hypothetical protein